MKFDFTFCRPILLAGAIAASAISLTAAIRNVGPDSPMVSSADELSRPMAPESRGAFDDYWGHQGYPSIPERANQAYFLTRIDTETDGVPTRVRTVDYDRDILPSKYVDSQWDAASQQWVEKQCDRFEWDSLGRMLSNGSQRFEFDAEGRMAVCEYIYFGYRMRYAYQYDETGHRTKCAIDVIYDDGTLEPYCIEDYQWSKADGAETMRMTTSDYYEGVWRMSRRQVLTKFDVPEGGWEEETIYSSEDNGNTWVTEKYSYQTFARIVPGMFNGYATSSIKKNRYGDKMCVVSESTSEVTELGNHTIKIVWNGKDCRYYSDGSLSGETPSKVETVMRAFIKFGSWQQETLSRKTFTFNTNTNEWFLASERMQEFTDNGYCLRDDNISYSFDGSISKRHDEHTYDDLNRRIESVEYVGNDKELNPRTRYRTTYVGSTNAHNTYEYTFYNTVENDWNEPAQLYEYEWDASIDGSLCYIFAAYPQMSCYYMYLKPISRTLTTRSNDVVKVEIERYHFSTPAELGGVEDVKADVAAAAGPVTVFSLSGVNLGVFDSADNLPLTPGVYLVRQGDLTRKVCVR